ncbi:hematopoietic cell signal transducer [Cyprinodon tularosa]|uniref:TYRO protein tyrosine kinase-binding protein-like n=1 Tax=Cyprinodon variegatus TaxID=28743 RepID=UPI0007428807|nr:PREDICTED: TYRO protein tyrosine kinase-binding protein-like [Cyprinodon variegatus]XP_038125391.1 hematopoietic cell signal transducer [Cyprinodon tularosa]
MANNVVVLVSLLCSLSGALAGSNVSCYRIEPGTMAGIISADLMLTLLIVGITYKYASYRRQKVDNADKIYMNVRANIKNKE